VCPLRARGSLGRLGQPSILDLLRQRLGQHPVPLVGGVLIDHCGARVGVAHPAHELFRRRTRLGDQCVSRVAKVVEVQPARRRAGHDTKDS
jgi:hypothetical protein